MKRVLTKATVKDMFSHVLNLDLAGAAVTVCLASSPAESLPEYQRLTMTDAVRREFENVVRNVRSGFNAEDVVFREYDAGSKPDAHEIEYLSLAEADFVADQFAGLDAPTSLAVFSGADEAFLAELRFYIIVQQAVKEEPVYWFRIYSRQKELGHSRLFGIMMQRGQFDQVREPMFLFDQYLDCVATARFMFVFRQDGFQKIFRYYERVREAAAESLARIEAAIPIANFQEFRKDCEAHLQKLAKLRNIAQKPYLDRISMADLKRVIRKFELPVEIARDDNGECLVYDQSDKWAILRLLDDDYLASVMTKQMYEVTGKRVHHVDGATAGD